jgi:hypothetical protein
MEEKTPLEKYPHVVEQVISYLDIRSTSSLSQVSRFFKEATHTVRLAKKLAYHKKILCEESDKLEVEEIKKYINLLIADKDQPDSFLTAFKSLTILGERCRKEFEPLCDNHLLKQSKYRNAEEKEEFKALDLRLQNLELFYGQKFCFVIKTFKLFKMSNLSCHNSLDTLVLYRLIDFKFKSSHERDSQGIIRCLNWLYDRHIIDTVPFIALNSETGAIHVFGKPIDDCINKISDRLTVLQIIKCQDKARKLMLEYTQEISSLKFGL